MHITEPLLQPHQEFAICCETEMPRLDDAGMHRPDGDLMQCLALSGEEFVRRRGMSKPRPRVAGADRVQFVQIADGALKPDRRRMFDADGGVLVMASDISDDVDVAARRIERGHFNVRRIGPQAQQRQAALCEAVNRLQPAIHFHTCLRQDHPSNLATFWKPVTRAGGM